MVPTSTVSYFLLEFQAKVFFSSRPFVGTCNFLKKI